MSGEMSATSGVLVGQLPLAPPVLVGRDATIQEVARVMVANGLSAVLVGGEDAIVSEHDVVDAMARRLDPDGPARMIATYGPFVVLDSCPVLEALRVMLEHSVRNLVVVRDDGSASGVLSLTEAAAAVLSDARLPSWLHGLRLALRVEVSEG
ncbi:MAG: CBS domain-containing protein [Acidimicrobiia bacterium]